MKKVSGSAGGMVFIDPCCRAAIPDQPWAQALAQDRRQDQPEPHTRCKPSGGPRQHLTPYGVEFLEMDSTPNASSFWMWAGLTWSGPFTWMDGPIPSIWSPVTTDISVGAGKETRWLSTPSVTTRNSGSTEAEPVHTEQLHLTERLTRLDANILRYEATIDDPRLHRARTGQFNIRWANSDELFEYVCQDNNFAHTLMVV